MISISSFSFLIPISFRAHLLGVCFSLFPVFNICPGLSPLFSYRSASLLFGLINLGFAPVVTPHGYHSRSLLLLFSLSLFSFIFLFFLFRRLRSYRRQLAGGADQCAGYIQGRPETRRQQNTQTRAPPQRLPFGDGDKSLSPILPGCPCHHHHYHRRHFFSRLLFYFNNSLLVLLLLLQQTQ